MAEKLSNAAALASELIFEVWGLLHLLDDEELEALTRVSEANSVPGFVAEDHRRLNREFGDSSFADMISAQRAYRELSGGDSTWSVAETIAVRADRLALQRRRAEFSDGSEIEWLAVVQMTPDMLQQRLVLFEFDDEQAALELVEELHAAHPEPVDPDAARRQIQQRREFADDLRRRATDQSA